MAKYAAFIKRAKELGAGEAKLIQAESIYTAEWVRLKCQFGCGGYAQALTCPPHSPSPEQTARMLSHYKRAVLVHGDEYTDIRKIVAELEREVFLEGYHKAFGMGSGPCELCESCGESCRHPYEARPSMEACGIDVFSTVRANGFPIEVLKNTGCRGNYYGVVLIE